jgi:hypothetical protein
VESPSPNGEIPHLFGFIRNENRHENLQRKPSLGLLQGLHACPADSIPNVLLEM